MIIQARADNNVSRQFAIEMIFMSTLPLQSEFGVHKVMEIFSQCVAAYDLNAGCSYTLFVKNRPVAFAFTLDAFETNDSAPHLHAFSVYPSQIKKGYGTTLLVEILKQNVRTGITLECYPSSSGFFAKSGLKVLEQNISCKHLVMYSKGA